MGLLGTKTPLDRYKSRSQSAMGIFTKTMHDLLNINQDVEEETSKNVAQIEALELNNQELNLIHEDNQKVINKIEDFLNM